jgi:4-amino-4-deoxy-L-arabinose transferase-like glycosyltransferase
VSSFDRSSRDRWFSALLFVVALLPRLYVAIAWAREPVWDGHYYDFGARRIAEGFGYSDDIIVAGKGAWHPWCHYPVGYSGFLAIFYKFFGSGPSVAPVVNAVVGALLAVVVHRLARYGLSQTRARIAGTIVALNPGLIIYTALLMTEPLAALGLVTGAWHLCRHQHRNLGRGALLAGVTLGLTTLVRPQSLLCAPALALLPLATNAPWRIRARRAVLAVAIAVPTAFLVVLPWTLRNCRVMDGCAFVSTNAGWNLAIGAFPRATGRFETLRATDGCPVVTGQVQQDRCWMDEGINWIRQDPARWLSLIPKKLSYTFDHESFPIGYLSQADPAGWPEEAKFQGRAILSTTHCALLAFAALGVIARPSRRMKLLAALTQIAALLLVLGFAFYGAYSDQHPFWPLAIVLVVLGALPLPGAPRRTGVIGYLVFAVASVALTHAIFFGEDRYHLVITPAVCVLAASALRRSDERPAEP